MELEISVKEISNGLKSVRATDRKKNAESLRDFLANSRNAVPTLLNQNTIKKKGYTWDHLFDDINEFILKETEKFESSKTYNSTIRPLCTSLLHSCVAGSNRGKAYITCSKITEICLYILNDKRLVKAIGDEYLRLLLKHVLSNDHYLSYITPSSWKDLLDVCVAACFSNDFNLDDYTKLRLVYLVMLNGTDNCQFVKPLMSSLCMLEKYFLKINNDKKAQEVVIELVILLLEMLSTECRLTMCHFIENILPSLLKYYDQNKDYKKKSSLFKLFNLAVLLHHPQARLEHEESSLAHNWDKWKDYLNRITNIIYREVEYIQKNRKQNDKTFYQCPHFCQLAAFLHYQMFMALDRTGGDPANSAKRQRLNFKINNTFSELLNDMHQNHVPWLGIVHVYVQKYGESIPASDYVTLLNYMQPILTNDHNLNWEAFEELACLALKYLSSKDNKGDEYDNTLTSLWNTCVRNCTTMNPPHKPVHTIMQILLNLMCLKYEQAHPLIKLYLEKDMPVTNNSVNTLNVIFHKFYNKSSPIEFRMDFFNWLTQADLTCLDVDNLSKLVLKITASENVRSMPIYPAEPPNDDLREILFSSIEKCILFSEFEKDVPITSSTDKHVYEQSEMISDIANNIDAYFKTMLTDKIANLKRNHSELQDCIKLINVVLTCYNMMMKHDFKTNDEISTTEIYALIKSALKVVFSSLILVLKSNQPVLTKVGLVQLVEELLLAEFEPQLSIMLRARIDGDFFHCINNILNIDTEVDNNDVITVDEEREANMTTLKHHCVYVLAAYCRKNVDYRDELLKLILNRDLYNFASDMPCVFRCIDILKDGNVEDPPLEMIFTLMQYICKDWYRDAKVSLGILKVLVDIIDRICSEDGFVKENCIIMVRVFMQRCEDMHYSPQVASYIYDCVAKIAILNRKANKFAENTFECALIKKLKGEVHALRVQCCYLMRTIMQDFSDDELETFLIDLLEIFVIDAIEGNEHLIKDESANRTLTVLHTFLALAQGRKSSIQNIILQVINVQKLKSLNKRAVKKVLNKIITIGGVEDLKTYLNDNILSVIHFWFNKNNNLEQLPLYLFEFDNIDLFTKKNMKWLVAADILWRKRGNVAESDVLNHIRNVHKLSVEDVLETCFSNIILLCLPYIVSDKYNIECYGSHKAETFNKLKQYANKMFQSMGQILENNKWSNLFVENVGELLLLTATHMTDHENAERLFEVKLPQKNESYYYPKRVFTAILNYFHDLTDGNVILYLCENQTTSIFKILVELWKNVIQEHILEYRILALHTYLMFVKHIPLDCPSDVFVCNFLCKSFTHAIRGCSDREELRIYIEGLKISFDYLLPKKICVMRKSVLELLPVVVIKKEEGYHQECDTILSYLNVDMKEYLEGSEGVIDFLNSISQDGGDSVECPSMVIFLEKMKGHKISLKCPSHETLLNIRSFIKINKHFVDNLWLELDSKRFSEDCKTSVIHQFVYSLCCILKSSYDDKTIIEACNCLSEIGSYDLKTLVTVPPSDAQDVTGMSPKQYFAIAVVKSLLDVLFDKDPLITGKVIEALTTFLKCRQVGDIMDLDDIRQQLLRPFLPSTTPSTDTKLDYMKLDDYCIQLPNGVFLNALLLRNINNHDWLKQVTCTLLGFIASPNKDIDLLQEVCTLKVQVCRRILPALVGLLLQCSLEPQVRTIGEHINNFFNYIWEETFDVKLADSGDSRPSTRPTNAYIADHEMVVQNMLDIVDFVRVQRNINIRSKSAAKKNDLELEYDKIAWAATLAHQNWAAIYYGELWAVLRNDGVSPSSPDSTAKLDGGENLQRIFRKCYVSIGEIDAIEGCGTAHLTIEDEKRKHLINTGHYSDALLLYDIALSYGTHVDPQHHFGVVRSLHKSGMHHLALQYIKSQPDNEQLTDVKYECLSFLGNWSEFVDPRELEEKSKQTNCHHNSIIKAFQYVCLKNCLNVQNTPEHENKVMLPLNKAKVAVSRLSKHLNMDNCQNVYKILAKIRLFNDIEDYFSVRSSKAEMGNLLQKWNVDKLPQFTDFKHLEPLISQRVLILEHAAKMSDNLINEISSLQIEYSKMALSNHRVEMAQRLLTIAKKSQLSKDVILVESEISWAKGHKDIALSLLRNIILDQTLDTKLSASSLRQYALWIAELKFDNPRDIINKYLLKSLEGLSTEHVETRLKVYHDIAKFADAEYKQVVAYMNSSVYENRVKCVENMRGTASSLNEKPVKQLTDEERKALSCNMNFKALDEAEIASTRMEKENFLRLAMRYYLLSLKECNENNLSVFRVISLWLDNRGFDFRSNNGDNIVFEDLLHTIPSWKYVSALPQLAPHLTNDENAFIKNLKKIIKRCALEHPHHTLPILFGLKNSKKDQDVVVSSVLRLGRNASQTHAHDARTLGAHTLVGELSRDHRLTAIIAQMEKLCDATISFANYQVPNKQKVQNIPDSETIHKLRNLNNIPVPTVTVPIRPDCKYSYISTLKSFEARFELVGGINNPKKINCIDSAGKKHVMLIKGRDDLRQDAVMQQVFNIVNALLEKDPVTSRNKLLIRTYKVVPMSRQSGVLEWCEGTVTLGGYLVGPQNSGAHSRYRPQDIPCDVARKMMIDCGNESNERKLAVFNSIISRFKPVFHNFFTEHYLDPVTWYERRLAYTKSVATSSMLGYILGLGDRHVFNILIDQRTAEVIHIDLGIAFDQGKTLRTPETVPFRLTQDIMSGFGSCGIEGIFRRCCEKTMQLLRDNQETLLTILEVLLCDPLYSWSVKTAQQNAPAPNDNTKDIPTSDSNSGLAKRALLIVSSKLSGTEEGVAGGVAVAGQVARLLHAATDSFNLCRLFNGWQPYL